MSAWRVTMEPDGRLVIPALLRAQLGMEGGGTFIAAIEDGAITLEPLDATIRRVQAEVRRYVPGDAALADDLSRDRRREAEHE